MGKSVTFRSGTAMQDSDVKETVSQWSIAATGYIMTTGAAAQAILVTSTGAASASVSRFLIVQAGAIVVQATSTSGGFTGINITSGQAVVVACYRTQAGTLAVVGGTTAATVGACALPAVPATAIQYGALCIQCSAGGVFTGGTTALDSTSLTVDWLTTPGPSGFCMQTSPISLVSGG